MRQTQNGQSVYCGQIKYIYSHTPLGRYQGQKRTSLTFILYYHNQELWSNFEIGGHD